MKDAVSSLVSNRGEKGISHSFIRDFIFLPVRSGLFGFLAFFAILTAAKFLGYLIGSVSMFKIDIEDVGLSFLGFVLVFLIRILENFKTGN